MTGRPAPTTAVRVAAWDQLWIGLACGVAVAPIVNVMLRTLVKMRKRSPRAA